MSASLEDALREAAKSGRLNGLTLWSKEGGWQGNARWNGRDGWSCCTEIDPVDALIAALRGDINRDVPIAKATPVEPAPLLTGGLFD